MSEAVKFHKQGKIGIITLDRPDHKNTITAKIAMAFSEIKAQIDYGSDVAALVITGNGQEAFCAGTDVYDEAAWENGEQRIQRLQIASMVGSYNQPVIAAINGDAFDQGLELALAIDIRIASSSACFAMSQIRTLISR